MPHLSPPMASQASVKVSRARAYSNADGSILLHLPDGPPRRSPNRANHSAAAAAAAQLTTALPTHHSSQPIRGGGTFLVSDDAPAPARAANVRDSIISIVDDPFFQRYHSPALDGAHQIPETEPEPPRDEPTTAWPPPRRESLTVTSSIPWVQSPQPSGFPVPCLLRSLK